MNVSPITVVIVDDEFYSRQVLKDLFLDRQEFKVIAECSNGKDAIEAIDNILPDVVFMDISMPGLNGFDVVNQISCDPAIIFATAYDNHAIEAYKNFAIGYLLKPIDKNIFNNLLNKVASYIAPINNEKFLPNNSLNTAKVESRFIIKEMGKIRFVDISDIEWIKGAGNYVELHQFSSNTPVMYRRSIKSIMLALLGSSFIQIHRSVIVRKEEICQMRHLEKGDYEVELKSGRLLNMSRNYRHNFQELF